jgi:RND superfamily putative drug exporter
MVQHRPWSAAIGSLAVIIVLAAPLLGLRLGFPDASNDPPTYTTRQAHELLAEGFGPGFSAPILIVAQGDAGSLSEAVDALGEELLAVAGVAQLGDAVFNQAGDTAVVNLIATSTAQDAETRALVEELREETIPTATAGTDLEVAVGGMVPANIDVTQGTADRLPLFFAGVLLLSFLLLMMIFRSVLVPLKAVVMNVLASAAAFGVLALAANGGRFGELVGIPEETPVPIQLPIGIFAILFGLSMDYEVFLLSRIKEEYDKTRDNARAVADGLAKSARVITAGAAVMVTVFLSFALGDVVIAKMFGIGLAAAILIDATLIRMVLVPATMQLMGDRNWWLPPWLDRLLPHLRLEDTAETPDPDSSGEPPVPAGAGSRA